MQKEYSKISPTALFCARMRAKQNIPFAKEIIEMIDTKYFKEVEDLPDYGNTLSSKSDIIPFIEGRYYSLNDFISKRDNLFIVEIASGLSPRSLNFTGRKDVVYFETELKGLINIKEQILKEIISKENLNDSNLFFMPINPLERKDMDNIGKIYLKKGQNKKLIIIHEGLLMYFDRNEKKKFMDNIRYLFEKYAKDGLWLTSDFSRIEKKLDEPKGPENIRDKISKVTNRDFNYFKSEYETKKFLIDGKFKFEIISNEEVINLLIEKKDLQANRAHVLETAKGYRIWKVQLA